MKPPPPEAKWKCKISVQFLAFFSVEIKYLHEYRSKAGTVFSCKHTIKKIRRFNRVEHAIPLSEYASATFRQETCLFNSPAHGVHTGRCKAYIISPWQFQQLYWSRVQTTDTDAASARCMLWWVANAWPTRNASIPVCQQHTWLHCTIALYTSPRCFASGCQIFSAKSCQRHVRNSSQILWLCSLPSRSTSSQKCPSLAVATRQTPGIQHSVSVAVSVTVSVKPCPYLPFMPLLVGRVRGNSAAGPGGRAPSFPRKRVGGAPCAYERAHLRKIELDPIWTDKQQRRTYGNGKRYFYVSYGVLTEFLGMNVIHTYFATETATARIHDGGNEISQEPPA